MYSKNWKTKLFMIVVIGFIFIFAGCSTKTDKSKTAASESKAAEVVKSKTKKIEKNVETILAEKDKDKKLSEYKKFVTEANTSSKLDKKEEKITKIYTDSMKKIQTNFKEQDDKDLKENTLDNLEESTEKDLSKKITTLDELKKWMQKESTDIYSKAELDSLIKKIDDTITTYKNQLEKIKIDNQEAKSTEPTTESSEVTTLQENASEELQVVQTHLLNSIEEAAQYLGQKLPQSGGAGAFENGQQNSDGSFTFHYQLHGGPEGITWNIITVNNNGEIIQDDYFKTVPNEAANNSASAPNQASISELEAAQLAIAKHNELGRPNATDAGTETTADGYYFYYMADGTDQVYKYFVSNSGQVQAE
ncbi:TPA: hypothetical protein QFR97_001757 [Enterococcus faecium]